MILMGAVFQCLDPILTIAAGLSYKDPFLLPIDKKDQADMVKKRLSGKSHSDHLTVLRAYEGWVEAQSSGNEQQYVWSHFLSAPTLRMMRDVKKQFEDLLHAAGFISQVQNRTKQNRYSHNEALVKAVLCAGLFPNVASIQCRKWKAIVRTHDDGKVDIHPGSVNAKESQLSGWLVYNQKVKSTSIYLRDCTAVSDLALLLFGGKAELAAGSSGTVDMLNGWVSFNLSGPPVAKMVMGLRQQLAALLQKKFENPHIDISEVGLDLVEAVKELLDSQKSDSNYFKSNQLNPTCIYSSSYCQQYHDDTRDYST